MSIALFDYYEISNHGNIRSKDRVTNNRHGTYVKKGRKINPVPDAYGYKMVHLHSNGKGCTKKIHRLVAETFMEKKEGCEVNHIDCDKTNNFVSNLEWITHQENMTHANKNGLISADHLRKLNFDRAKISSNDVENIKAMLSEGHTQQSIAEKYNVCQGHISKIKRNLRWAS